VNRVNSRNGSAMMTALVVVIIIIIIPLNTTEFMPIKRDG